MSGVKNFVSNTGALLRGDPFSQVKSPKANGVKLSTPSVASGEWSASGIDWASAATGFGASQSRDHSDEAGAEDFAVAAGFACAAISDCVAGFCAAASAGDAAGAAVGRFIATSCRVALLATTCSEGTVASG